MKDRPSLNSALQNGVRHARRVFLSGLLVLLGVVCASAQTALIKGTVVDDTGEPLIGASVSTVGAPKVAVVTDIDGNFSIRVAPGTKLSFSYVGYETQEHPAKDGMEVTLTSSTVALQGVEVVAYGVQKKITVTGAISSVKGDDLVKTPVSSVNNVLAGQLSGVTTVQYSGEPGSDAATVFVRGQGTWNNSAPLIQVDGVERSMSDIDPEEIESITVLKDASATAVFGVRGANGVVLITTKRGEEGKPKIDVSTSFSALTPTRMNEMANSYQYAMFHNQMSANDGNEPMFGAEIVEKFRTGSDPIRFPSINWTDYLMKKSTLQTKSNVNISGGTKSMRYFVSLGLLTQGGLFKEFDYPEDFDYSYNRFNYRANLDLDVTSTTTLSFNVSGIVSNDHKPQTSQGASGMIRSYYQSTPFYSAGIIDGRQIYSALDYADLTLPFVGSANPMEYLRQGSYGTNLNKLQSDLQLTQKLDFITEGLSFRLKGSYNSWFNAQKTVNATRATYSPVLQDDGSMLYRQLTAEAQNTYKEETARGRDWYFEAAFNYSRRFGLNTVGALLLYNQSKVYYPSTYSDIPQGYVGLVGRVTYDYDNRYMAEFNFGYNGSENFAKGHRFGFFPSVAVGWVISNERFFERAKKVVSLLKVRASYGLSGNDYMSDRFQYISTLDMSSSNNEYKAFLGLNPIVYEGIRVLKWGNENLTWETSRKTNIGIELGLFDELTLIADLFEDRRDDIFMTRRSVPASSGFQDSTPYGNIGGVLNRGLDMSLEYNKAIGRDLVISVQGSLTFARNEVTFRDEPRNKPAYMRHKGKPVNAIEGLVAVGLFKDQADIDSWPTQDFGGTVRPGDIKYLDLNGDRKVDGNDVTMLGHPTVPELVYGLGASIRYKKFDFSFFFQGVGRVSLLMSDHHPFVSKAYSGRNMTQWIVDDHWSEADPNPRAAYPRLSDVWNENNTRASSFWIRNGAYLRLKNAELGFTHRSFRFYVAGSNLLTFSKFKLWDPELGNGNGLKYPLQRVVKLGVQYNF